MKKNNGADSFESLLLLFDVNEFVPQRSDTRFAKKGGNKGEP